MALARHSSLRAATRAHRAGAAIAGGTDSGNRPIHAALRRRPRVVRRPGPGIAGSGRAAHPGLRTPRGHGAHRGAGKVDRHRGNHARGDTESRGPATARRAASGIDSARVHQAYSFHKTPSSGAVLNTETEATNPVARAAELLIRLREEIGHAMVGQTAVVDQVIMALIASGHVLVEGVPGLGKTLLVRALAQALSLNQARVQFTPDLMPTDITGHAILDPATHELRVVRGPV